MRNILLLMLFLGLQASAQNSLLYRISGNGLTGNSYLFGTIHMQDEKVFQWNQQVFQAIDACQTAAFELDLDPKALMQEMDTTFFQKVFLYLAEDLVPALMDTYTPEQLADNLVDHLLPFYQGILENKTSGDQRLMFMDQYLQAYAARQGKTIWGVESMQEQFQALFGTDMQRLTEALVSALSAENLAALDHYSENQEQLLDHYASMNVEGVCGMVDALGTGSSAWAQSLYNRLLDNRNQVMAERLMQRMKNETVFVAVGAGHLCGSNGLVEQLRKVGYTLSPIDHRGSPAQLSLEWVSYDTDAFSVNVPEGVDSIEIMDWFGMPQLDRESPSTLFTTHGLGRFKVEEVYNAEELEEAVAMDWESMELSEPVEGEFVAEETEEMESEYAEEEYAVEEMEGEYAEEEYAVEEMEMVEYEGDMEYTPQRRSPFGAVLGSMDPQAYITPEMQTYFMSLFMQVQMKSPDIMSAIKPSMEFGEESTVEERTIVVNGREETLVLEFGPFSNSASCTIEHEDRAYILSVEGDRELVRSNEIEQFFTTFRVK